jgi:uncharacterized protein YlxW (UPF0749 family)
MLIRIISWIIAYKINTLMKLGIFKNYTLLTNSEHNELKTAIQRQKTESEYNDNQKDKKIASLKDRCKTLDNQADTLRADKRRLEQQIVSVNAQIGLADKDVRLMKEQLENATVLSRQLKVELEKWQS